MAASLLGVALALLTGCSSDPTTVTCGPSGADTDCDGVINSLDVMPYAADLKDYDSDGVINKFDKWPLQNDNTHDTDGDGTPDYLDTFVGNNSANFDNDELPNGLDASPYTASEATPPPQLSNEALNKMLLEQQMKSAIIRDTFGYQPDRDFDGTPDKLDGTPTPFDNDRDGDGDPDFYDPEPGNSSLESSNDPYDPRNDQYWEDD